MPLEKTDMGLNLFSPVYLVTLLLTTVSIEAYCVSPETLSLSNTIQYNTIQYNYFIVSSHFI